MTYNPLIHHRRSVRLPRYDYSQPGFYFVTVCTRNRECLFGRLENGEMWLSDIGHVVAESWKWLVDRYSYVTLDQWILMPNHLHGIIRIADDRRGGSRTAPTRYSHGETKQKALGSLIGAFKTVSTKKINQMRNAPGSTVWQRNYYEHVVRSESSLNEIRNYIMTNPTNWRSDKLFDESR